MREILFRGKSLKDNEWTEGYYCRYGWTEKEKDYIIPDYASALYGVEVDSNTIGQYTGLTDKNGTKIFEGDIVRYGDTIHKVVFEQRNGTAYFGLVYSPIETLPFGHYQDLQQLEVIGNIYENPELIGGADDENNI